MKNAIHLALIAAVLHLTALPRFAFAEYANPNPTVQRGLDFLRTSQSADGTFSPQAGPGLTALALTAALRNGVPVDDPMVARGLKALEGFVKPDGGIYGNGRLKNYETCIGILAFDAARKADGANPKRYDKILADANNFVRGLQVGAAGEKPQSDPWYGGVGYGGPERPDLSNTAFLVEALHALDADAEDEAVQRALVFVSRCQNLDTKHNDTEFANMVNDGGFYYVIPTEKVDPSEDERYTANGGLRSYGSMTYAGFKSLVYAGLTKDDPRTTAALTWISNNYSVEDNPGQGNAGLYYYYHSFASALDAARLEEITDADGEKHDWRADLIAELAERQQDDGSWVNENRQWFENDKNLCTAFALLALAHCQE